MTEPTAASLTPEQRQAYRDILLSLQQRSQESYDRTVVTLSSGALGISFVFLEKFVGTKTAVVPWILIGAWLVWTGSVTAALYSHLTSAKALRQTLDRFEANVPLSRLREGTADALTRRLNAMAGVLFVIGVLLMMYFALANMEI